MNVLVCKVIVIIVVDGVEEGLLQSYVLRLVFESFFFWFWGEGLVDRLVILERYVLDRFSLLCFGFWVFGIQVFQGFIFFFVWSWGQYIFFFQEDGIECENLGWFYFFKGEEVSDRKVLKIGL